eukprot:CCRYP_017262-RA/>CCRYP_017262-RA protein AED:0.45 eAED:0.86 QI:0/0/0/1/0/0/3/0/94
MKIEAIQYMDLPCNATELRVLIGCTCGQVVQTYSNYQTYQKELIITLPNMMVISSRSAGFVAISNQYDVYMTRETNSKAALPHGWKCSASRMFA